jgi:hypothetical protein
MVTLGLNQIFKPAEFDVQVINMQLFPSYVIGI